MMEEAFRLIDDPDGESTYLRLSTRSIARSSATDDGWKDGALERRLLAAASPVPTPRRRSSRWAR